MADYVVEHLPAVYVFEYHVIVMLMYDHLAHAANVGVVEQLRERSLTNCANLFGGIFCRLLGGSFGVWRSRYGLNWDDTRKYFDGKLWVVVRKQPIRGDRRRKESVCNKNIDQGMPLDDLTAQP